MYCTGGQWPNICMAVMPCRFLGRKLLAFTFWASDRTHTDAQKHTHIHTHASACRQHPRTRCYRSLSRAHTHTGMRTHMHTHARPNRRVLHIATGGTCAGGASTLLRPLSGRDDRIPPVDGGPGHMALWRTPTDARVHTHTHTHTHPHTTVPSYSTAGGRCSGVCTHVYGRLVPRVPQSVCVCVCVCARDG